MFATLPSCGFAQQPPGQLLQHTGRLQSKDGGCAAAAIKLVASYPKAHETCPGGLVGSRSSLNMHAPSALAYASGYFIMK